MKIRELSISEANTVENETPTIGSYLSNLSKGRPMTPRSWLYEQFDPAQVLLNWKAELSSLEHGSQFEAASYQFDLLQEEKYGPQGGVPKWDEAKAVYEPLYEKGLSAPLLNSPAWQRRVREYALKIGQGRLHFLRPREYDKVVLKLEDTDKLETNSGWPDFTVRKLARVRARAIEDAQSGKCFSYPCIPLFRFYNGKLRPIWMFPMSQNLREAAFEQVLQEYLQGTNQDAFAPWTGFEQVKKVATRWYNLPDARQVGSDVMKMDAYFKILQMETAAQVVSLLFQPEYKEEIFKVMLHVNQIDMIVPGPEVWTGEHGIASGSGWTQMAETLFQGVLWSVGDVKDAMIEGDDGNLLFLDRTRKRDEFVTSELLAVGLPAKLEKQSDEEDSVVFLQRRIQRGQYSVYEPSVLRGVYPTIRALKSAVYPERWHSKNFNDTVFFVRTAMIVENTIDHPLYVKFAQFIAKGQKDLIPFSKLKAEEVDSFQRQAKLLPGLNPTYNQEKREKPLSSFETIKIWSKM